MSERRTEIKPVNLRALSDELMLQVDGAVLFLHLPSGKTVLQSSEGSGLDVVGDLPGLDELFESPDYLPLPDTHDIHEWDIMRRFAESLHNEVGAELLGAIHGNGAFRMFKSAVRRVGIEKCWFAFRENAIIEIAREWCDEHGVPYVTD